MASNRNVLFIIIDQLRADCVFGDLAEYVDLPNIRALSADAVTFNKHYSVVNPCGPSRASILTGQYAMNHRSVRNGTPLRHDTPNLASEVRKAGYLPLLFGYSDTSQDPRVFAPGDPALQTYEHSLRDFQEAVEMRLEESYPWRADLISKGYTFENYMDIYRPVAPKGRPARPNDPAIYSAADSDTAFLTNACLSQLAARSSGDPWFAHLTYIRPHPPFVAPAPYNTMYDPAALPLPARLPTVQDECEIHPFFAPYLEKVTAKTTVCGLDHAEASDEFIQGLRAVYLGLATEVDTHVGRVVEFLKQSNQYDDTLIVLTSDHGEMLGDRHSWGKQTVYDASYHTPLIIRDPDNAAQYGQVIDAITESIDITPTILSALGVTVPTSMDGRNLMPFLSGATPEDWRDYSYCELDFGDPILPTDAQTALGVSTSAANFCLLRGPRYTLVHFAGGLPPMLFDHQEEGEFRNIANDPANAGLLLEMTQLLLTHRMENPDHTLSNTKITRKGPVQGRRR